MAKNQKAIAASTLNVFCMLLTGIGVGWLIGLSVSPVLHIIVAGLIALVVSIVAALAGLEVAPPNPMVEAKDSTKSVTRLLHKNEIKINPLPIMTIVLGIAAGSIIGIYARTNEWLGADPQRLAMKWNGIGLEEKDIKKRLFDHLYPPTAYLPSIDKQSDKEEDKNDKIQEKEKGGGEKQANTEAGSSLHPVLYSTSSEICASLLLRKGDTLRAELKMLKNKRLDAALDNCKSDECLEMIRSLLCSKDQ